VKNAVEKTFMRSAILFWGLFCVPLFASAQQYEGEKLFKQSCAACHTINQGRLTGPDLVNIQNRRSQKWISGFIKSSQSLIKRGDSDAVDVFKKFNKMVMPDNDFTDSQIVNVIQYIAANSSEQMAKTGKPLFDQPISEDSIRSGQMLFNGRKRFTNGGASCISCHNIDRPDVVAGGSLAKELTNVYSRMGAAGVKAIIDNAPFPTMAKAYDGRSLSDHEIIDLAAFLQSVDGGSRNGPFYGARLFFSGLGGAIVLFALFAIVQTRSKKNSVNHEIYERQVKTTWEDNNE